MKILNVTQHNASKEQTEVGVFEPETSVKEVIKELLTFNEIPSKEEMEERADRLAQLADGLHVKEVMVGGAPFFMSPLVQALKNYGIKPVFSFSTRDSVEKVVDGKTIKTSIFRHAGFVEG